MRRSRSEGTVRRRDGFTFAAQNNGPDTCTRRDQASPQQSHDRSKQINDAANFSLFPWLAWFLLQEDTNILADSGEAIRPSGLHIYFCLRRPCTLQTDDRINRDYMSAGAQGSVVATIIGDLCNVHTIHPHANDSRPESWATHDYESPGRLAFLHRRRRAFLFGRRNNFWACQKPADCETRNDHRQTTLSEVCRHFHDRILNRCRGIRQSDKRRCLPLALRRHSVDLSVGGRLRHRIGVILPFSLLISRPFADSRH